MFETASARPRALHPPATDITAPSITGRMADAMLETRAAQGCCTDEDLIRRGFTAAEIHEHGIAAHRVARLRSVKRVNPPRGARP